VSYRSVERRSAWVGIGVMSWSVIGMLILAAIGLYVIGRISSAIVPLALAVVIVVVLKGSVNRFEGMGMKRGWAVGLAYLVSAGLSALAGVFIIPPLIDQGRQFVIEFPKYYERVYELWIDLQTQSASWTLPVWVEDALANAQESISGVLLDWSQQAASGLFTAGSQVIGLVFNVVLALVIAFYLLRDLPRIREGLINMLPERQRSDARKLYVRIVVVIGGYLKGQLIISAFVGLLSAIGLGLLGVPFALFIGLLVGVFNIVPYLGPVVGSVVAAISAAFVDPWLALWAVLLLVAVQQVEGLFLSPRIMSEQVDLHPVLVILSMLVGGTLLGFVGLLIAIPIAAAGKGVLSFFFEKYGITGSTRKATSDVGSDASDRAVATEQGS